MIRFEYVAFQWYIDERPLSVTLIRPSGHPSVEQFSVFLDAVKTNLQDVTNRRVFILDIRSLNGMTAHHRSLMAEFRKEAKELQQKRAMAFVYLIASPFMRGALNASFWLLRPAIPMRLCGSVKEARPYIVKKLAEEGLEWPAELETQTVTLKAA